MKARIYLALGLTFFLLSLAARRPRPNVFPGARVESVSARSPRLSMPALTEEAGRVEQSGKSEIADKTNSRAGNEVEPAADSISDGDLPAVLDRVVRSRGADATEANL